MIYFKWWKGRTFNQEHSTQQDSRSDLMGEIKSFPYKQNIAPPNQLYYRCWRNFFRQETQNKKKTYRKSSSQEVFQDVLTKTWTHLFDSHFLFFIPDFFFFLLCIIIYILTLLLFHPVNLAYYPFLLEHNSPSVFICFVHQTKQTSTINNDWIPR